MSKIENARQGSVSRLFMNVEVNTRRKAERFGSRTTWWGGVGEGLVFATSPRVLFDFKNNIHGGIFALH